MKTKYYLTYIFDDEYKIKEIPNAKKLDEDCFIYYDKVLKHWHIVDIASGYGVIRNRSKESCINIYHDKYSMYKQIKSRPWYKERAKIVEKLKEEL